MHLAGLSGVGKTRTVLEACRDQPDLSGVFYIPRYASFGTPFLRHLTRNAHLPALVVIDEVLIDDLSGLTSQVENYAQRLRFVTIGPARRGDRGRESANILVLDEPDTHEGVLQVVRRAGDGLSEPVLESIARFAAQDLRLALMLVEASRQGGEFRDLPIQDGEEVWKRVTHLFRDRLGNLETFRTNYPYLTVAIDVGIRDELRRELVHVAARFAIPVPRSTKPLASQRHAGSASSPRATSSSSRLRERLLGTFSGSGFGVPSDTTSPTS